MPIFIVEFAQTEPAIKNDWAKIGAGLDFWRPERAEGTEKIIFPIRGESEETVAELAAESIGHRAFRIFTPKSRTQVQEAIQNLSHYQQGALWREVIALRAIWEESSK